MLTIASWLTTMDGASSRETMIPPLLTGSAVSIVGFDLAGFIIAWQLHQHPLAIERGHAEIAQAQLLKLEGSCANAAEQFRRVDQADEARGKTDGTADLTS